MTIEALVGKIINIKNSLDKEYEELGVFYFSDENVDEKFFEWLKDKNNEIYLAVKSNAESENPSVFDFLGLEDSYDEDELLEIFIEFVSLDKTRLEELEDNLSGFNKNDYRSSDYDEDYNNDYDDYSKEDRYDDYDFYDEDYN